MAEATRPWPPTPTPRGPRHPFPRCPPRRVQTLFVMHPSTAFATVQVDLLPNQIRRSAHHRPKSRGMPTAYGLPWDDCVNRGCSARLDAGFPLNRWGCDPLYGPGSGPVHGISREPAPGKLVPAIVGDSQTNDGIDFATRPVVIARLTPRPSAGCRRPKKAPPLIGVRPPA